MYVQEKGRLSQTESEEEEVEEEEKKGKKKNIKDSKKKKVGIVDFFGGMIYDFIYDSYNKGKGGGLWPARALALKWY